MARPALRTARIELLPMTVDHLPLLHSLDSDPETMRYLLGRARTPEEIDAYWSPRCADTSGHHVGLGWWVGFAGSDFLGWWDLGRSDSGPERVDSQAPEIGWRVLRHHWGRGFATEGASALLEHGFRTVQAHTIWAETMAVNRASRRVMEKLGMRHVRTEHHKDYRPVPGADQGEVFYTITAQEWVP